MIDPGDETIPEAHEEQDTAPEEPAEGSGAKVSAGHASHVSSSTRNSPPPHRMQSPRTEPPSLLVNMFSVSVPLGMVQQTVRLNDEAL